LLMAGDTARVIVIYVSSDWNQGAILMRDYQLIFTCVTVRPVESSLAAINASIITSFAPLSFDPLVDSFVIHFFIGAPIISSFTGVLMLKGAVSFSAPVASPAKPIYTLGHAFTSVD